MKVNSTTPAFLQLAKIKSIQDNRELENVYEEIQKKMGKRSVEKGSSSQAQVQFNV